MKYVYEWKTKCAMCIQGCHGQGKVRGKLFFFASSGKSQGILYKVREILNSSLKSGNFIFRLPQALIMIFFMVKRQCPFKEYPSINAKAGH